MRKSIEVTITEDGNPIVFRIQQMSATEQERWIIGVGLAIAGCAGAYTDIGDDISGGAIMGMIEKDPFRFLSLLSGLKQETIQPLLEDLIACCYHKVGAAEIRCSYENIDGVLTDVFNLLRLKVEALKLNFSELARRGRDALTALSGANRSSSEEAPPVLKIPH